MVYPGAPFVTLFDGACCKITAAGKHVASDPSRGLVLKLEPATDSAIVADPYTQEASFDSELTGHIEPLPGGNEFVGWVSRPRFSEHTASGRMLLDAVLPGPDITYRAIVEPWLGLPLYQPGGAARRHGGRRPSMQAGTVQRKWSRRGCSQDRPARTSCSRPPHRKSGSKPRSRCRRGIAVSGSRLSTRAAG